MATLADGRTQASVDLYWLPLGAGGHSVRLNGKVFEAVMSLVERRRPLDLYHSALEVRVPEGRYTVESAPVPDADARARGVVGSGPVGSRWAGRFRIFRYEIRCWRDGVIPDLGEAVESPRRLTEDEARRPATARAWRRSCPRPCGGATKYKTGDMWNSNSIVSWLLASSCLDAESISMPSGGRAPGWDAGLDGGPEAATSRLKRASVPR